MRKSLIAGDPHIKTPLTEVAAHDGKEKAVRQACT